MSKRSCPDVASSPSLPPQKERRGTIRVLLSLFISYSIPYIINFFSFALALFILHTSSSSLRCTLFFIALVLLPSLPSPSPLHASSPALFFAFTPPLFAGIPQGYLIDRKNRCLQTVSMPSTPDIKQVTNCIVTL